MRSPNPNLFHTIRGLLSARGSTSLKNITLPDLVEFEKYSGCPVVVYHGPINDAGIQLAYECLSEMGDVPSLGLVLSTGGGQVNAARRFGLLLHQYAKHITVYVPYQARSSGTLLCLAAHELILGPMAELSPIDANIVAEGEMPDNAPPVISTQDIRAFHKVAEEWFDLRREEDRLQVFTLLCQRIFPTTLSTFYRSDALVRQIASQLLQFHRPECVEADEVIINQLVSGYHSHNYVITPDEVIQLGLNARHASKDEALLLWSLFKACRSAMRRSPQSYGLVYSQTYKSLITRR